MFIIRTSDRAITISKHFHLNDNHNKTYDVFCTRSNTVYITQFYLGSRVQRCLLSGFSINGNHRRVSPASEVPNARPELISSRIGLVRAPKSLSGDILSPTMLRSLTIYQSKVVCPSHTASLQLDCIASALAAREARDPRHENPQ